MGYGFVVEELDGSLQAVAWGVLSAPSRLPLGERLHGLYGQLLELMRHYRPAEFAVEEPFVSVNARTAMAIGQAQGLALMAAAEGSLPVAGYSPRQVKSAVTGHGAASKEQVQYAVSLHLSMGTIPTPEDAADALAVALCHIQSRRSVV